MVNPCLPSSGPLLWNASTGHYEAFHTPTITKIYQWAGGAGTVDVWTPAANKAYHLLGFMITYGNALTAATALMQFTFSDSVAGDLLRCSTILDNTYRLHSPIIANFPGNGIQGSTDSILRINFNSALSSGGLPISLWGFEE